LRSREPGLGMGDAVEIAECDPAWPEAYERERGFYFDYRSGVPGPVFETTAELVAYLRAGLFDTERVRRFAAEWFEVADGRAAERFVSEVVIPALEGTWA